MLARTVELAPNGLGYGNPEAKISLAKQLEPDETGRAEITVELVDAAKEKIASGECMVRCTHQDSGCIDGRCAHRIILLDSISGLLVPKEYDPTSGERRPLVAGGGYITARPAELALRGRQGDETAVGTLQRVIGRLKAQGIYAGAHTGPHANSELGTTDCGANDKYEIINQVAIAERAHIEPHVGLLYGLMREANLIKRDFDTNRFAAAMRGFTVVAEDASYYEGASGQANLDAITDGMEVDEHGKPTAVVKELSGEHKEDFIILNFVRGTTFDQAALLQKLHERFPDRNPEELAQIFVVDIWHIVDLAEAMGDTDEERDVALMAMLTYQLATAATLTDGTLPVFAMMPEPQAVPVGQSAHVSSEA